MIKTSTIIGRVVVMIFLILNVSSQAHGQRWAFYTRQHRYRFGAQDPKCVLDKEKLCNIEISRGETRGQTGKDYSLNFIEFKDDGTLYDSTQLKAALEQIRAAQRDNGEKVIVFIYAHGWHNSAEERTQPEHPDCAQRLYTGDVDKFRHCGLEVLANNWISTKPGVAPRIVGIYLAWHGWDFGWPPLVWVPSYFLRMPKARSIGLEGTAEAVQQIFHQIEQQRDSYFTIAMGHSFGARVLEAALDGVPAHPEQYPNAGILKKIRDDSVRKMHPDGAALQRIGPLSNRLPVDLVFYVNAATSNADTIRTQEAWRHTCTDASSAPGCRDDPLYYAVSSRADVLTAVVMPVANLIALPIGYALRTSGYSNGYHLISAANTPWMQTHDIPAYEPHPPAKPPLNGFCFQVPYGDQDEKRTYLVTPKPGKTPARLWAMNSDHWSASLLAIVHKVLPQSVQNDWVISSHGDVWNTGVFNMVRSVIDTQYAMVNNDPEAITCRQSTNQQHIRLKP